MTKTPVCCQDARVEKAFFGKRKGRMFFYSVNIICVCVCLDFADSGISKTHLDLPNNPNS